jgi:hypothetical protein
VVCNRSLHFNSVKREFLLSNIYTNPVRNSQETNYVSATEPKSLFVVRTIRNTQIHCVDRMQSSVIYTNPVRTSQETHYVSATETSRLMLFRERSQKEKPLILLPEAEHINTGNVLHYAIIIW